MSRHGSTLRQAAVAQWEVRFRAANGSPAWRVVGSSPTGEGLPDMWWSHSPQVSSPSNQQTGLLVHVFTSCNIGSWIEKAHLPAKKHSELCGPFSWGGLWGSSCFSCRPQMGSCLSLDARPLRRYDICALTAHEPP